MDIKVNGDPFVLADAKTSLQDALQAVGLPPTTTGIAVAVNMELVPSSEWPTFEIHHGDEVEVITARQGG